MSKARTNATGRQMSALRKLSPHGLVNQWNDFWGRASYQYFNWRRDTSSDLLLFAGFNVGLLLFGSLTKVRRGSQHDMHTLPVPPCMPMWCTSMRSDILASIPFLIESCSLISAVHFM